MALPIGQTVTLGSNISTGVAPGQSQYQIPGGAQAKILGSRVVNGQLYYDVQHIGGGTGWVLGSKLESIAKNAPTQSPESSPQEGQSTNPLSEVNQIIEKTFQDLQNEVSQQFGEYRAGKPFRVDEVLAEKGIQAKEQIDPYYNEKLGEYLLGVTRKINRSQDDTQTLLTELSTDANNYTSRSKAMLDESVRKAGEGFADVGLFGSGDQLASEGQLKYDANNKMSDYLAGYQSKQNQLTTGLSRTLEDVNAERKNYVRDLERNRLTDIETRTGDLTKEAGQQYIQGFKSILPPQLQAASGFDLLKDLGIYS